RSIDQLPPMLDYDIRHGRTYMYFQGKPIYPFGYGLSYTTFEYRSLRLSAESMAADGAAVVTIDVKNTGLRGGEEVVQMYVRHPHSRIDRARLALRGFRRIHIEPGETKAVQMDLKARDLAYWDMNRRCFSVEDGEVEVMAGSSSASIELRRTISIT
ncbi:MAG TPA: fibronectin type III-like domain-contianing protein, partial [Polyangiaceae bacterium]|nr:fibronectin type III-like domain-contianing protein [Polyangiaceae bacterium]